VSTAGIPTFTSTASRAVAKALAGVTLPDDRTALELAIDVARSHGAVLEEVLGPCRHRTAARARRAIWAALRETTSLSYPEIGRLFERDHTTILNGVALAAREALSTPAPLARTRPPSRPEPPLAGAAAARAAALRRLPTPDARTWLDVVRTACAAEGAPLVDVLEGRTSQSAARARHAAWRELRALRYSLSEIGEPFGVDHRTVLGVISEARAA
jgi:chromosomal replication initiation ATPase DnaA